MVPCVRLCYGLTGTKHHRRRRATQPDFHAGRASPQGHSRLCCIWSTGGMPKPCLAEGSDRQGQFVERGGNSKACWLLYCELVVATPKVLHKACPANTTVALRSCLSPGIGRSRAFSRPWSHSMRLLAYWSVRCHAAGSRSSSTAGYAAARSVVTSIGVTLVVPMARSKNRRAAAVGVGVDVAGQLLVSAGDNPERLHGEAAFAHLCGTAPIPASSGRVVRHRLM